MTDFQIREAAFEHTAIETWARQAVQHDDWPVVYTINGAHEVYVGESQGARTRLLQHIRSPKANSLNTFRVVLDNTFNKSVCLDLESYLIRLFNADQRFTVLNKQSSTRNSSYYDRDTYQQRFDAVFEALREQGLFTHDLETIQNSNLFKLSPFTSLTQSQALAVEAIVELVHQDSSTQEHRQVVVQGGPGTGKTVVAIFLAKLLADLSETEDEFLDVDTFADEELTGIGPTAGRLKIGFVVPQQSLRETVKKVFKATPALRDVLVLTPYDVVAEDEVFDVLIVDEAHRLQQFSGALQMQSSKFRRINTTLFSDDSDGTQHHQLDWIRARSRVSVLMLDKLQTIRPMSDLPSAVVNEVIDDARQNARYLELWTQMRTKAGEAYTDYVSDVLSGRPTGQINFTEYDLRLYDDIHQMRADIYTREAEVGLSRMLAGFAWKWVSRVQKTRPDIEIDGLSMFWNRDEKDWINSPTALEEVGCIHTSQGYDLNYAGVIIGPELQWDPEAQRPIFVRENYHDRNGRTNNVALGQTYSDEDLLQYVINIYRVLMTRGIHGTYVYVCDPNLRQWLRRYLPGAPHPPRASS